MDNIRGQKQRLENGDYNLYVDMLDDDYFKKYESVDVSSGQNLIKEFLDSTGDDGDCDSVQINYNKASHIVNIKAHLTYAPNDHKTYEHRHKLM